VSNPEASKAQMLLVWSLIGLICPVGDCCPLVFEIQYFHIGCPIAPFVTEGLPTREGLTMFDRV
jgi:hypothetical protein